MPWCPNLSSLYLSSSLALPNGKRAALHLCHYAGVYSFYFLLILHAILELASVLCFNTMVATLPASARVFSCSSSCLDDAEAFGGTISAKAALASTYIVEDFT